MTSRGMNVHLYPSPILHESRIWREVESISRAEIFDQIEVAGVAAQGLARTEDWVAGSTLRRFGADAASHTLKAGLGKTAAYGRALLRHYSGQPVTVINCHSLPTLPAALALKRMTGAALVYDAHELETETTMSVGIRRPLLKGIERLGIRGVDHTFVVSRQIERWYRATYHLTDIDTLYNFPAAAPLPPIDRPRARDNLGIPPDTFLCLYQGVISDGRGIGQILDAFTDAPSGVAVLFVGYGAQEDRVRAAAENSRSVYFHPAVPPDRLMEYTMLADVGLSLGEPGKCLSYDYSAPNKLFQYVHAGVPVIASGLVEQVEFLTENRVGVVTPSLGRMDVLAAVSEIRNWVVEDLAREIERVRRQTTWDTYQDLIQRRYQDLAGVDKTVR